MIFPFGVIYEPSYSAIIVSFTLQENVPLTSFSNPDLFFAIILYLYSPIENLPIFALYPLLLPAICDIVYVPIGATKSFLL